MAHLVCFVPSRARRIPIAALAFALAAILFAPSRSARAEDLADPKKPGPYPVGVTTVTFIDPSRTDATTQGPRTLLTDIWYPATDDSKTLPKNKASDFLLSGPVPAMAQAMLMAFKIKIEDFDKRFENVAVRDARIRDGKFPLIVFSHGNGGIRNQSTFWCDYMASHGYIVASPDHTGNCAYTAVDGKLVAMNPGARQASAIDRPKDVSFIIDMMGKYNLGADSRFSRRLDMDHVGVAGHSFGGFTSIHVINSDTRVKAIIPMAPVWMERTNYTTPVMMMIATEDKTIGLPNNAKDRTYYEESKGPHYLVEIKDGGHYSFSDMGQIQPKFGDGIGTGMRVTKKEEPITYLPPKETFEIINSYSVAFFGVYLKGQTGYNSFLGKNEFGDKIDYKFAVPANPS